MKVWTYYYARIKDLPPHILPVSIAGWAPKGWTGEEYKKVAPKKEWFFKYKETQDKEYYKKMYSETVLSQITPKEVMDDLSEILHRHPGKTDIALCCYEKSGDFCHRNLLASFLSAKGYGIVEEWTPEKEYLLQYLRWMKSYEKTLLSFGDSWKKYGKIKPESPGIYLTVRCGFSGIYTCLNHWDGSKWGVESADGSETIAFKKEQIEENEQG